MAALQTVRTSFLQRSIGGRRLSDVENRSFARLGRTVGEIVREAPVDDAAGYAALLIGAGAAVDAWETTYVHLLPAAGPEHPVLRWMEGTALRPVKAALADPAWRDFRAALGATLAAEYPARNGYVAFPFRRIFTVATIA